jgi:polar amino acid transport system permease protein/polar amino acid transport system substrate-binding protein
MNEFKTQFYDNFIADNRYLYLLRGFRTTIILTIFAVFIGIALGFLVAIIRSTYDKTGKLKIANLICNIYLTIIRGTPAVVQLLIMFYVIFASYNNSIVVAIITFGINSGAYVAEIIRSGIMSIDNGQFEAGRSLGFSYSLTMIYIILPQAFKNVLPALANEFIVLLKETSICGYIGLMDLTRGGDIIRSRTYEPFMPLIAVALIYLVLVMILTRFVKQLERRLRTSER